MSRIEPILPAPEPPPHGGGGVSGLLAATWLGLDALLSRLRALATALPALDLRLARILAWLRTQDLAPLGYPGWEAFVREQVEWGGTWLRRLLRLVRSGLTVVLQAASEGRIPLSVAIHAPVTCPLGGQEAWLIAPVLAPHRRASGASSTIEPEEADALAIWHARGRARLLEGLRLTDREADARILEWWRSGCSGEDLVAAALAPAPAPRPAPGDGQPDWGFADPAEALLGPWRTPTDLADAMALLGEVQQARHSRTTELGRLYERVVRERIYRTCGFADVETFCQATMGRSARTLQRHRALGRVLRRLPSLDAAADAGMSLARIEAVGTVATEDDVDRWLGVAARAPVGEIQRAAEHVGAGADPGVLLDGYEALMAATTGSVALDAVQAEVPGTLTDRVHPDLPEAARWLLSVEIPRQRGFSRVKERARFVCANPECRRRALRNHAHHLRFRTDGGDDTPDNGACLCPSCHLRLVHPGHVRVERVGETLVWTWPDRSVTVGAGPAM